MLKAEFLSKLRQALSALPPDEVQRQINYYSELIDDMMEDGLSEIEAITRLGRISDIAESILQEQPLPRLVKQAAKPKGGWTALTIILAIIGFPIWFPLLLAFAGVLFGIIVAILAVIFSAFVVVLALGVSGVGLIILAFFRIGVSLGSSLWSIGVGLLLIGLCVLAVPLAVLIAELLVKAIKALYRWVKSLFIKKEVR